MCIVFEKSAVSNPNRFFICGFFLSLRDIFDEMPTYVRNMHEFSCISVFVSYLLIFLLSRTQSVKLASANCCFYAVSHHRISFPSGWVKVKSQFRTYSKWLAKVPHPLYSSMKLIPCVGSEEKEMKVKLLDVLKQNCLCRCRYLLHWESSECSINPFRQPVQNKKGRSVC